MWRQEGSSGTFLCLSKANVLCSELLISQLMKNSVLCVYVPLCMCVCVCVYLVVGVEVPSMTTFIGSRKNAGLLQC